jgi:hypothetical protein
VNAGTVVAIRQRTITDRFLRASATSPATAKALGDVGVAEGPVLRGLARRGVVVQSDATRWYLDPAAFASWRRRRRVLLLVSLGLVAAGAMVALGIMKPW